MRGASDCGGLAADASSVVDEADGHPARRIMIAAVFAVMLMWQPGIGQNGVVNAASQIPPTLPGGTSARGALFTIHGVRLTSPSVGRTTVTVSGMPLKILSQSPK